jgi:hypothetical protein
VQEQCSERSITLTIITIQQHTPTPLITSNTHALSYSTGHIRQTHLQQIALASQDNEDQRAARPSTRPEYCFIILSSLRQFTSILGKGVFVCVMMMMAAGNAAVPRTRYTLTYDPSDQNMPRGTILILILQMAS